MSNKIHFTSLGCPRNLVDSEVMIGILLRAGYEITDQLDQADYLIVNTCGFLESARRESRDVIEELLEKGKPGAKVIATGCMVQKDSNVLKAEYPDVHAFLGSGDAEAILSAVRSSEPQMAVSSARSYLEQGEVPRQLATPQHYAYLKIAEGCAKRCSFCIIPDIKGKLRSKSEERVEKEFKLLLKQGVREIILIAQDLGDYGRDRKEKGALAALLRKLLQNKGDFWLRLLYLYPDEIDDELIEIIKSDSRLCPYLDMPIQHIDDQVLKRMHRKTNAAQIKEVITKLRERIPEIVIRTSLMVGFPGETEEQFEKLVAFVKEYKLDNVGIFQYSKEKESYSAKIDGHLSQEVKQERFDRLSQAQFSVINDQMQRYLGKKLPVVVEGYHPDSEYLMVGRFYGQCPEIDGQVIINDTAAVDCFGKLYEVEVEQVMQYDLVGRALRKIQEKSILDSNPLALIH